MSLGSVQTSRITATRLRFSDLNGWGTDDHAAALAAFERGGRIIHSPFGDADTVLPNPKTGARRYFERYFQPLVLRDAATPLITGYYEPVVRGARAANAEFQHPLYRLPADMPPDRPGPTRAEITAGALKDRGLELVWLADPVDAFLLQVQGSGRVALSDGDEVRVGYAGRNGYPYRSIGQALVAQGAIDARAISAQAIRDWIGANGKAGLALLNHNPSYVFFREITDLDAGDGPRGTIGVPLTAGRSLAVDPSITPLGAPVWVTRDGAETGHLLIAQDTGSAILGAQRGDIFVGTGAEAGAVAGQMAGGGSLVALLPKPLAARYFERG